MSRYLATRAAAQSAGLFGLLLALIFGSGGSFRDVRAWVFYSVFVSFSVIATVWLWITDRALLERRLAMGERGEPRLKQRVIQRILGLAFIGILVGSGLDRRLGWSHVPLLVSWLGDFGVVFGFVIVLLVFRANTFTSAIVEVAPKQSVVTTGPYRFVRHPMYAGAVPLLIGIPLALGSFFAEGFAAILVVGLAVRLRDEEQFLKKELDGYEAYMHKTRWRLIPFVW